MRKDLSRSKGPYEQLSSLRCAQLLRNEYGAPEAPTWLYPFGMQIMLPFDRLNTPLEDWDDTLSTFPTVLFSKRRHGCGFSRTRNTAKL